MSAARVLNPVITEFCKIRASPAASLSRNLPCGRQLSRIKRDLFGPANPSETNKIFKEELEKHQERATKKWGFDFRTGSPLATNSQFIWERVSTQESIIAPEMYTLTRAAHVRPTPAQPTAIDLLMDERAERENLNTNNISSPSTGTDTDSCDDSHEESPVTGAVFKVPASPTSSQSTLAVRSTSGSGRSQLRKRQPKITEYMKERKRLAQTPRKVSPAKRMRTSSGSSTSSTSNSSSSSGSPTNFGHHLSAHFSLRSRHN